MANDFDISILTLLPSKMVLYGTVNPGTKPWRASVSFLSNLEVNLSVTELLKLKPPVLISMSNFPELNG